MAAKKPCDFCGSEWHQQFEGISGHNMSIEIYPDNNLLAVISFADNPNTGEPDELEAEIPMNYCPNCGRKLC